MIEKSALEARQAVILGKRNMLKVLLVSMALGVASLVVAALLSIP